MFIHWIVICLVESVIQALNNWTQKFMQEVHTKGLNCSGQIITPKYMQYLH